MTPSSRFLFSLLFLPLFLLFLLVFDRPTHDPYLLFSLEKPLSFPSPFFEFLLPFLSSPALLLFFSSYFPLSFFLFILMLFSFLLISLSWLISL
eukprot:m.78357 g.78357  ORF g.78357 m.78357 type:complete len:94 (-) comp13247_c0_seq1:12834-13115(-)